jgi:multisubunit Na+/H+ antiporter MnhC subunit
MEEPSIKPIGFKPDGSHMNKGAIALIICILIGVYCIFADNLFSWLFSTNIMETK